MSSEWETIDIQNAQQFQNDEKGFIPMRIWARKFSNETVEFVTIVHNTETDMFDVRHIEQKISLSAGDILKNLGSVSVKQKFPPILEFDGTLNRSLDPSKGYKVGSYVDLDDAIKTAQTHIS